MSLLTQALTFPGVILPAFVVTALLLAVLLRHRTPESPWRYREILLALCALLAICCVGFAVLLAVRAAHHQQEEAAGSAPAIEADMLVSRGNLVDLYLNDWEHQPERVPLVAGERHVYRFTKIPPKITLVRIDPTELADARIVIYSLTVKAGNQVVRQFGPEELKNWRLHDVSASKDPNGGLAMLGTTDDPFLYNPVAIQLPGRKSQEWPYYRSFGLILAASLLIVLPGMATRTGPLAGFLSRPVPSLPARYRRILASPLCFGLVVLLAGVGTLTYPEQAAGSGIVIEVDMLVSRGNAVNLYLNDPQSQPERVPVVVGQRHIYRFLKLPGEITLLRLDPTDLPDARIVIYGLRVKNGEQILQQLGPADLKSWQMQNLSLPREENGGLLLTGLNQDPALWSPLMWRLPGGKFDVLSSLIASTDGPFLLAITAFLVVLLARMSAPTGRMQAVLVALDICITFPVVWLVMKLSLLPSPPVTSAIGYTNLAGYAKANEYLSSFAVMLTCILLGYAFTRLSGPGNEEREETVFPSRRRNVWIAHGLVFVCIFLYFLPNMLGVFHSLRSAVYHRVGWDESNWMAWGYMLNQGLRPLRDFWFPYSGLYLQYLPFPAGTLWSVLHCTIALGGLYLALFQAFGRRLAHALVIFGLIVLLILLNLLPGWDRYLLAIDVALFYVAICDARRLVWQTHAPFAVVGGYAFFCEPTQMVYAGAGILAHTLLIPLSLFQVRNLRQHLAAFVPRLKRRAVTVGVPLLAGITASLLIYGMNGLLPGLWDFEMSIGDQGVYGAVPSDITAGVLPVLQPDSVFLLMFLLASCAVYRAVRGNGRSDPLGTALIVLCGSAFLAMQKQVLRPHVISQVRIFPYMALLIFGLTVWRERKPAVRMMIAAFLGCMLGIAVHRNALREFYENGIKSAPHHVSGSIDALLHHRNEFNLVNSTLYDQSRFVDFDAERTVVNYLVQECGLRAQDSVYVLGDSSIFYLLLNQRPPYLITSYNSSPIYEQQKVLDWFHLQSPRFVIWVTDALSFDSVPHAVRLPLIYSYVIGNYKFSHAIGPYHILARRSPDEPPDLDDWCRVLGDRLDLWHLPRRARLSEYTGCSGDVARCDTILVLRYKQPAPVPARKLVIDIAFPGHVFRIQFDVSPGEREYVVNLNRLWFWNALAKSAPARITAEDAAVDVATEYRRERTPLLY